MKRKTIYMVLTIIVILLMIIVSRVTAQDSRFLNLYSEYKTECDSIVFDTLTQTGTVKYDIVVVSSGDIKLVPKDTVWDSCKCDEYKENVYSTNIYLSSDNYFNGTPTLSINGTGINSYSDVIDNEFTTTITRNKYCKMKLRMPSFDHYWEWLREKGHRE